MNGIYAVGLEAEAYSQEILADNFLALNSPKRFLDLLFIFYKTHLNL